MATRLPKGPSGGTKRGTLFLAKVRGNKRRQWTPGSGITLLQESTNNANGLTRDLQGRMILCEGGAGRVTRMEPDGSITVVANSYQGMPLNRPNDVVVRSSDGSIYFSNPGAPDPEFPLPYSGVYRVSADLGTISLLVSDFAFPNGLVFSPDESILYIADYRGGRIRAFDVNPNGMLNLASDRVFCQLIAPVPITPYGPDGMKVDVEGNVYSSGPRRRVDHRPGGQPSGDNPHRGADDQRGLGRGRLEDLVRHNLRFPVPHPDECRRNRRARQRVDYCYQQRRR